MSQDFVFNKEDQVVPFGGVSTVFSPIDCYPILKQHRKNAEERETIYHYTDIGNLEIILKSKTLLLNRLDKVNDRLEPKTVFSTLLEDEENKKHLNTLFVSSWSYHPQAKVKTESLPQWHIYTSANDGIRIELHKKGGNILDALLDRNNNILGRYSADSVIEFHPKEQHYQCGSRFVKLVQSDIHYCNDLIETMKEHGIHYTYPLGSPKGFNITPGAVLKDDAWEYEHESRFLAFIEVIGKMPEIEDLLIPIRFNDLDEITITYSPWLSSDRRIKVKELCENYLGAFPHKYHISELDGLVQRKL